MRRLALVLMLVAVGCGGGTAEPGEPDAGQVPTPDAGSAAIPLAEWVHDLVENRSADDAEPDTVDDKNIADTEDPAAFDAYVPE